MEVNGPLLREPETNRGAWNVYKVSSIQTSMMRYLLFAILSFALCISVCAGDLEEGIAALNQADYASAISSFTRAAERGDAIAQYKLARMFHDGQGIERDHKQAFYWYRKAAGQGNADAQFWVAVMYRDSIGVARDYAETLYWLKRAAERGSPDAQFTLGQLNQSGEGFPVDDVQAYVWFSLASLQGDAEAKAMMERLEKRLTQDEIVGARQRVREWKPR